MVLPHALSAPVRRLSAFYNPFELLASATGELALEFATAEVDSLPDDRRMATIFSGADASDAPLSEDINRSRAES